MYIERDIVFGNNAFINITLSKEYSSSTYFIYVQMIRAG